MENNIIDPFDKVISPIAQRKSSHVAVFTDFCRLSACALALQTREPEYLEVSRGYTIEELSIFANALGTLINLMQEHPYRDILGDYYLEIASARAKKDRGEFYTPTSISDLMSKILIDAVSIKEKNRPVRISDPACGSGNILLSVAKTLSPDSVDLMRVTAQDISRLACDMCYINMTLWGIPAKVIWGNTLTLETFGTWTNIHWHRVGENVSEIFDTLIQPDSELYTHPPEPSKGQMTFEW